MNRSRQRHEKLAAASDPKSPIAEAYRTLRTNIQFASIDKELKTLMVTSTGPEEGKSTTISNLAIVTAQSDLNVLLVDADLRKPTIHHTYLVSNQKGLSTVVAGRDSFDDAISETNIQNLWVIPSGPIPPNPAELLNSVRMNSFIREAKERFDMVLFDAPPVLAVTDAQVLAAKVDGTVLVIKASSTPREQVAKAKTQLMNVKANLLGTVLNSKDMKREGNFYYYYGES